MLRIKKHVVPFPFRHPCVKVKIRGAREILDVAFDGNDLVLFAIVEMKDKKAEPVPIWIFKEQAAIPDELYDHNELVYWKTIMHRMPRIERMQIKDSQAAAHVFCERKFAWLWLGKDTADENIQALSAKRR